MSDQKLFAVARSQVYILFRVFEIWSSRQCFGICLNSFNFSLTAILACNEIVNFILVCTVSCVSMQRSIWIKYGRVFVLHRVKTFYGKVLFEFSTLISFFLFYDEGLIFPPRGEMFTRVQATKRKTGISCLAINYTCVMYVTVWGY